MAFAGLSFFYGGSSILVCDNRRNGRGDRAIEYSCVRRPLSSILGSWTVFSIRFFLSFSLKVVRSERCKRKTVGIESGRVGESEASDQKRRNTRLALGRDAWAEEEEVDRSSFKEKAREEDAKLRRRSWLPSSFFLSPYEKVVYKTGLLFLLPLPQTDQLSWWMIEFHLLSTRPLRSLFGQ